MRSWSSRPSHLPQTNSWLSAASTPISPNTIPTIALQTRAGRWAHSAWNVMLCNSKANVCEAFYITQQQTTFYDPKPNREPGLMCFCDSDFWEIVSSKKKIWCFVLFRTPSDTTSRSTATFWKWPALKTSLEKGAFGVWILLLRANWWNKLSGNGGSEGWLVSGRRSDPSPPGEWLACVFHGTGVTLPVR